MCDDWLNVLRSDATLFLRFHELGHTDTDHKDFSSLSRGIFLGILVHISVFVRYIVCRDEKIDRDDFPFFVRRVRCSVNPDKKVNFLTYVIYE